MQKLGSLLTLKLSTIQQKGLFYFLVMSTVRLIQIQIQDVL